MSTRPAPPTASELDHLRPTNASGVIFVVLTAGLTASGVFLASRSSWWSWIAGEVLLAAALVEWFILLHEAGHGTLFRTKPWHAAVGHAAAFFALIPFHTWKRVHQRHHKWTGWQDVDPTTATLVPRPLSGFERFLVNVCWRYWIPLFATLYRLNNFWNVPRLFRLFDSAAVRRLLVVNTAALVVAYLTITWAVGPAMVARVAIVACLLAFIVEDVLLISQHTHIPMGLSHGHPVEPYPTMAQEPFTRSMRLPRWMSRAALHFDAHELHHMYPFVPGYRLAEVPYEPGNEVSWWRWVPAARSVQGAVLLFQNRNDTGYDV